MLKPVRMWEMPPVAFVHAELQKLNSLELRPRHRIYNADSIISYNTVGNSILDYRFVGYGSHFLNFPSITNFTIKHAVILVYLSIIICITLFYVIHL